MWIFAPSVMWVGRCFVILWHRNFSVLQTSALSISQQISVLVFSYPCFGYYVHGHSVHGHADTNMEELNNNLKREAVCIQLRHHHCSTDSWLFSDMSVDVFCTKESMCGQRGLLHTSDVQTFQVAFTRHLRTQYERIRDLRNRVWTVCFAWSSKLENSRVQCYLSGCYLQGGGLLRSWDSSSANQFEQKTSVYNTMNHFLRSFIDHVAQLNSSI